MTASHQASTPASLPSSAAEASPQPSDADESATAIQEENTERTEEQRRIAAGKHMRQTRRDGSKDEAEQNNNESQAEQEEEEEEAEEEEEKQEESDDDYEEEEGETAPASSSSPAPLPDEAAPPPLPNEAPPEDDGWEPVWDANAQAYYFYNRFTGVSQWDNPRVPDAQQQIDGHQDMAASSRKPPALGGYNPAIHGDYDPTAPYAQHYEEQHQVDGAGGGVPVIDPAAAYATTGAFNRFTGRWQPAELTPENFNDENKSHRQMRAFFDVDAAANSHDGRSLKAERSGKKLTKQELKHFKEKRREKKEAKRRAWLRD